jgi:hypothetical protein
MRGHVLAARDLKDARYLSRRQRLAIVTSVLVAVKRGTTGKRANGSFMICPLQ